LKSSIEKSIQNVIKRTRSQQFWQYPKAESEGTRSVIEHGERISAAFLKKINSSQDVETLPLESMVLTYWQASISMNDKERNSWGKSENIRSAKLGVNKLPLTPLTNTKRQNINDSWPAVQTSLSYRTLTKV